MVSDKDTLERLLDDAIPNVCQSLFDDWIERNASIQAQAGLESKIVRTMSRPCCEWCASLSGSYDYGTEPKDIYRRHNNCDCQVTFESAKGKYRQDAWSKRKVSVEREERIKFVVDTQGKATYNTPPTQMLKSQYDKSVEGGFMTSLVPFDLYLAIYRTIERNILFKTNPGGIEIRGITKHFMERVCGTMIDPKILQEDLMIIRRSGVEYEDVKDAIFNPVRVIQVTSDSYRFIGKKCRVIVNPQNGNLVSCNPRGE